MLTKVSLPPAMLQTAEELAECWDNKFKATTWMKHVKRLPLDETLRELEPRLAAAKEALEKGVKESLGPQLEAFERRRAAHDVQ